MEDSLQLPQNYDEYPVGNLLSPPPHYLDSKQTTPPHSLAYSNSTCAKDKLREMQMRSPLAFEEEPERIGLIKANNQNYPLNQQKTIPVSPKKMAGTNEVEEDRPAVKSQCMVDSQIDKKIQPKCKTARSGSRSPQITTRVSPPQNKMKAQGAFSIVRQQQSSKELPQRKTIDKNEALVAKKRIRELDQALHMETVVSEELRTKLSVTKSLLEAKVKDQGLGYLFALKNSSRDLKNIDIFVELTNLQKSQTQKNIIIDRLKSQLKQSNLDLQKSRSKKQASPSFHSVSPNRTLNDQLQKLLDQKQSLMQYIDQQKATLSRKIDYIHELQQEVNRISDKEVYYTNVERPKLVGQLGQVRMDNRRLKEELERVAMEGNLTQIKGKADLEQLQGRLAAAEATVIRQEQVIQGFKGKKEEAKTFKDSSLQKQDVQRQILLQELNLLKNQRDHYLSQYRKRANESAQLYALQMKLSLFDSHQN